ncbi:MAG: ABC transporter permease [bacterium]|nr:ABC transporter permease [bacterium]
MKKIFVIFKKEFLDTIRDRRTIMLMIVIPMLIIPLIMGLMSKVGASQAKKTRAKVIKVALVNHGNAERFAGLLKEHKDITIVNDVKAVDMEKMIKEEKLDFGVLFEAGFDKKTGATPGLTGRNGSGSVQLFFKTSGETRILKKRITDTLDTYHDELLELRLKEVNLEKSFVQPLIVEERDLASTKEKLGRTIGGFLPYIFILFAFAGAMYPAIDLAAGEKERSTLETLLTAPASRMQIVVGKFLVVTCAGIVSAAASIFGLFIATRNLGNIPKSLVDTILKIIEWKSVSLMLSLIIPLCIFFAAVLLTLSIFAKSFKEAQSIITPLNMIIIIPAAIGMVPGIKLNGVTALIPILNVSLASKEIIAGTIQIPLLMEVYLSLIIMAAVSLYFCSLWFKREDVIFRGI